MFPLNFSTASARPWPARATAVHNDDWYLGFISRGSSSDDEALASLILRTADRPVAASCGGTTLQASPIRPTPARPPDDRPRQSRSRRGVSPRVVTIAVGGRVTFRQHIPLPRHELEPASGAYDFPSRLRWASHTQQSKTSGISRPRAPAASTITASHPTRSAGHDSHPVTLMVPEPPLCVSSADHRFLAKVVRLRSTRSLAWLHSSTLHAPRFDKCSESAGRPVNIGRSPNARTTWPDAENSQARAAAAGSIVNRSPIGRNAISGL